MVERSRSTTGGTSSTGRIDDEPRGAATTEEGTDKALPKTDDSTPTLSEKPSQAGQHVAQIHKVLEEKVQELFTVCLELQSSDELEEFTRRVTLVQLQLDAMKESLQLSLFQEKDYPQQPSTV